MITKTDPEGNLTKSYFHQGNTSTTTLGEYSDHVSKIGKEFRMENQNSSGSVYKTQIIKWENIILANSGLQNERNFVNQTRKTVIDNDGDADQKTKAEMYSYSTTTGNLTQKVEWGEVTATSTDGYFNDTGTDKLTTDFSYASSVSSNVTARTSTETLNDQSNNKVAETKHYFDNLALGSIGKGNETKTEKWKFGSEYASTTKSYDGTYGLVVSETDGRGNQTQYTVDGLNLYPAMTTRPHSLVTEYLYNYASGKVKQTTDPNGRVFQTVYDGLGRPVTIKQPDIASPSTLVTKTAYTYTDNTVPISIRQTDYLNAATSTDLYSYFDGFNRLKQTRKTAETDYAVQDQTYNTRGLLASKSFPYFSSGLSYTSPSGTTALFTRYTYDPMARVLTVANAVGTTTTVYDDWKTTVTDPNGEVKHLYDDAFGNLARVDEIATSTQTTTYAYNGLNKLTKITDALGNVRNFGYDGLGRRTSAEDLHAIGDGTFGKWFYEYDNADNLASTTDSKSQNVRYTYDNINRVLTEDLYGVGSTEIAYGYDTCAEGKERLCHATTTDAVTTFAYNALGLPNMETKKVGGTNYATSYAYDRLGNITDITYPDSSIVKYAYNGAGQVETVTRKPAASGTYLTAISDIDYAPTGAITHKEFGNGVISDYTYDANALYRLTRILTVASSTWSGGGPLGLLDYGNLPWRTMLAQAFPQRLAVAIFGTDGTSSPDVLLPETSVATSTTNNTDSSTTTTPTASAPVTPTEESILQISVAPEQKPEVLQKGPYNEKADRYELVLEEQEPDGGKASVEVLKEGPGIRLKKWNGEVDLGVAYANVHAPASHATSTDQIEWKGDKEEVHAYPLKAKKASGDGDFELEVYLKEKLATNVFEFAVTGAENLDFFYQPPLNEETHGEEIASCTETQCLDVGGNVVVSRPENIVGSYAVYHKTKKNHATGGINYATGKAFHIYRPKAIDANEKEVWGVLSYANGLLTVEIPQEFLDNAAYPVRVDPTFGYATLGASSVRIADYFSDDNYRVGHAETTTEAGTLSSIHAGIKSDYLNYTQTVKVMVNRENPSTDSHAEVASVESDISVTTTATFYAFNAASKYLSTDEYILNIVGDGTDPPSGSVTYALYDSTGSRNNYSESFYGTYASAKENPWTETDSSGSRRYSLYATYTASSTNQAPTVPTSILTESLTNPTDISDSTPEFSAIYNDPDAGDQANKYRIQVATTSAFANIFWDSATTTMATTTAGNRSPDISYGGSALASSTTYYWRIAFTDDDGAHGIWSTTTATFSLAPSGGGGGNPFATILQNIFYTYDNVGNIANINDYSDTGAGKTVTYGYDDLHRLTSAVTGVASSTAFDHAYGYNALGNIIDFDGVSYSYAGTNYANPHAATTINGVTQTYDNNGNLANAGTSAYLWDWRNRLTAGSGSATTTFGYDHENQRVWKKVGSNATTTFANKFYNIAGATTTVHLFLPDGSLIATVENVTTSGGGSATSTNLKAPSATGSTFNEWTTPSDAYSSNDTYAVATGLASMNEQDYSSFSFNVPSGATINGIEVKVKAQRTQINQDLTLQLSWNNGSSFTSSKINAITSASDATYTYGGSTDTWGRSWTDTEFGNTNFRLYAKNTTSTNRNISIDHVQVNVYYTPSGAGNSATTTSYIHGDHLGGTNVVSGPTGLATEVTDYYPFGTQRIHTGTFTEQRKFTGHEYDSESDLTYASARYLDQDIGRFLSQDPVFINLGVDERTQAALANPQLQHSARTAGLNSMSGFGFGFGNSPAKKNWTSIQAEFLRDPQMQNSYSYARNNPINMKDPNGEFGIFAGGSAEGDLAIGNGVGGSVSYMSGFTFGRSEGLSFAGLVNKETYVGGPTMGNVSESQVAFGAHAGVGVQYMITNATNPSQLASPASSVSINLHIGSLSFTQNIQGIWTLSIGAGPGAGASINFSETKTEVNKLE